MLVGERPRDGDHGVDFRAPAKRARELDDERREASAIPGAHRAQPRVDPALEEQLADAEPPSPGTERQGLLSVSGRGLPLLERQRGEPPAETSAAASTRKLATAGSNRGRSEKTSAPVQRLLSSSEV